MILRPGAKLKLLVVRFHIKATEIPDSQSESPLGSIPFFTIYTSRFNTFHLAAQGSKCKGSKRAQVKI